MRSSRLPVLLAALLALTLVPSAAMADVGGRPAPQAWDVTPAPGEVVAAGPVAVAATALSESGVSNVRLFLDGRQVESRIVDQNDVAARAAADITVEPGRHQLDIVFTPNGQSDVQRTWHFHATGVAVDRLAGGDRIATAAAIARNGREAAAAPAAVLARADEFADALAGAPLAVAVDGPLLLTAKDGLSPAAADALEDLLRPNAQVTLLGGDVALSNAVAADVEALGFTTRRVAGASRFDTAAEIANLVPASDTAVVASGLSFPDALAVAAPAASAGTPVLLTAAASLPAATAERIAGKDVTIVGGPVAVSADVEAAIAKQARSVRRIGGNTRYDTAANIVQAYSPGRADTMAVASGESFADALAGAVDAANAGIPMMLTASQSAPAVTAAIVGQRASSTLRVYGGPVAVADNTARMLQAAVTDRAPRLIEVVPAAGSVVPALDKVTLTFDDVVDIARSNIALFFDGRELPRTVEAGDFDDTLVVTAGNLPFQPTRGQSYEVRVVGEVRAGDQYRHVDQTFVYRKIALSRGDAGPDVLDLQNRLQALGYWLGTADSGYGSLTVQAVMAFQKVEGLTTSGVADAATQARLRSASRPRPASQSGDLLELDKTRQVIFVVRDGQVTYTFNTSTGTERPYTYEGQTYLADTPTGRFRINRQIDGERISNLGRMWRPKYFHPDGIAIHGSPSIPNYPASHGCARMSDAAINFVWDAGLAPLGTTIWVYGRFPGT